MVGRGVVVGAWVAVAAGCYDPTVPLGLPCGDAGCPAPQVCEANVCVLPGGADAAVRPDARPDGAPDVDSDADGVFDDDDNCVDTKNADQHDEDHDAVGDACDFCPHRPDPAQDDADGDKVGDACDPGPETDEIVFFDPFTSDLPAWSLSGPWVRANDMLAVTVGSYSLDLDQMIGDSGLEVGGRVVAIGAAVPHQLTMRVSNDGVTAIYCEIFDDGTGDPKLGLTDQTNGTYTSLVTGGLPDPLPTGDLRFLAGGSPTLGVGACRVELAGSSADIAADAIISGAASWHMNVRNLAVELDYAIQIDAAL